MIKLIAISLFWSYAAVAGLPPTSTQGSAGGGYKTTFQFNFPGFPITYTGTNASFGTLTVGGGGTGQTSYTNGQLLIGNTTGNTLAKATLTPGLGISITNGAGSITISQTPCSVQAISGTDIDWSLNCSGGVYTKTLSANTTFTFSNRTAGQTIVVRLTNTASNYTVTWPTVKWSGGSTPTMTTGAKSDVYTFVFDGTDVFGSVVQNF